MPGESSSPPPIGQRLYSPRQVTGATLLGAPMAGCWLLASNYRALGASGAPAQALLWGAVSTVAVCVIALSLPEDFPSIPLPIAYTVAMHVVANHLQATAFRAHIAAGGLQHSSWRVVGIGLAFMGIIIVLLVASSFAFVSWRLGTPLRVNQNDDVYYKGEATEEDARRLGKALTESGWFGDPEGASVQITAESGRYAISFSLAGGFWDDPQVLEAIREMGEPLADLFGRPLTLHLCDEMLESRRSLRIE